MIYVFTGDGKGKTTAAIGTGIRAVGSGKKVLMVQFMKVKENSAEYNILKNLENFRMESFGRKGFYLPESYLKENPELEKKGIKSLSDIDYQLAEKGLEYVKKHIRDYDMIIMDEICVAVHYGLVNEIRLIELLEKNRSNMNFILTGRYCSNRIIEIADLVTEMREIKHYYKKGVPAVKGIDF
ncbi:cob(I)yrinic acid a,c-diamide adenosyltransferase [Persephonella sp.]